jgi:uncharacterized membrane protein YeiB
MVVTDAKERIAFFDVLRGVALFGILIVNVFSFGADATAWTDPLDRTVWTLKHTLFESKFWALYSLLFGMGFLPAEPVPQLHGGASGSQTAGSDGFGLPAWFVV